MVAQTAKLDTRALDHSAKTEMASQHFPITEYRWYESFCGKEILSIRLLRWLLLGLVWKMCGLILEQQDSNGGKVDEGQKRVIKFIISGSNPPKSFDCLKETLNQMPFLVQMSIYRPGLGNIFLRWNNITGPMLWDILPDRLRTISAVCQYVASTDLNLFQWLNGMNRIVVISGWEKELHRIPQTIYDSLNLCIQPSSGAANCLIHIFPRRWCFCTFIQVESMLRFSMSASPESAWNTLSSVP